MGAVVAPLVSAVTPRTLSVPDARVLPDHPRGRPWLCSGGAVAQLTRGPSSTKARSTRRAFVPVHFCGFSCAALDFALNFSRLRFLEPLAPVQVQEAHACSGWVCGQQHTHEEGANTRFGDCTPLAAAKPKAVEDVREGAELRPCSTCRRARNSVRASNLQHTNTHRSTYGSLE